MLAAQKVHSFLQLEIYLIRAWHIRIMLILLKCSKDPADK